MIGVTASQAFVPNKIADLILWLEASDISTIINSGGFVSGWKDKSKNGNNAAQTTGANQPTTGIETINGVNALKFDGINDSLLRATFTGGQVAQPNTIFVVWELPDLPLSTTGKMIDGGADPSRHVIEISTNDRWQMWAGLFMFGTVRLENTPYITASLFNTTSSEAYVNGVQDVDGDVGDRFLNGISIASKFGVSAFLNVKIGEIIIYNKDVSTLERQQVEESLSNKWGVALS